jgi:acetyl esterase/lipase
MLDTNKSKDKIRMKTHKRFDLSKHYAMSEIPIANTNSIKNKSLDVTYANVSPTNKLDIYLPEVGVAPFPVILAVHGGAFMCGDKSDIQLLPILEGLHRGYAIVSVNYRLTEEASFPAQIYDIKASIRWTRANSKIYNLDPDRIAAWGSSAGAYLCSLAGTTSNITELEDLSMGHEDYSSSLGVVVDWFGPIDFLKMDEQLIANGLSPLKGQFHSSGDSPESLLMGGQIHKLSEKVFYANPETYISPNSPPFIIQHGTKDAIVPFQQSLNFADKLKKSIGKDKVILDLFKDAQHADKIFETNENLNRVLDFLDKNLK